MENVRNLVSHDNGNTIRVILKGLHELGYRTPELPLILSPPIVRGHIPSTPCLFRCEKRGQMKPSPKGSFHRFFSPLHSATKRLCPLETRKGKCFPFETYTNKTLSFWIICQRPSSLDV